MGLFSGIGGLIGGIFGATQQKRAFNSAINDLRNFQQNTLNPAYADFKAQGESFSSTGLQMLTDGKQNYQLSPEVQAMRQRLAGTVGGGLSDASRIAFEDMNFLLKEDASQTGNLRSGAFAIGQAELGRRVVADELGRQTQLLNLFGEQDLALNKLDMYTGLGLLEGGINFGKLGANVLQLSQTNTSNIANMAIGRGAVQASQLTGAGAAIGGGIDLGVSAAAGFMGAGAAAGGAGASGLSGISGMLGSLSLFPDTSNLKAGKGAAS